MTYHIIFRKRATSEYLKAIAWYKARSDKAANGFVEEVNAALDKLEAEPDQFRHSYAKFREIAVKRYPFHIVYFIQEPDKQVVIASIFHNKRNPAKKY